MTHTFKDDPTKYILQPQDHRYHLLDTNIAIPSGGIADAMHEKAQKWLKQQQSAAPTQGLDPATLHEAQKRVADFLPIVTQHILNGERGQDVGVRNALSNVKLIAAASPEHAEFIRRQDDAAHVGSHRLAFGDKVLHDALAGKALPDGKIVQSFAGAEHLLSPEMIALHEMGHLLDYGIGSGIDYQGTRHHDPKIRGENPGLRMVQGLNFAHTSDALEKYSSNGGIALLPPPFGRLHYPSYGNAPPNDWASTVTPEEAAKDVTHIARAIIAARRQRAIEWPTVMSELGAADPSALSALDQVAGHDAKGRSHGQIVKDFWGFPFQAQPNAQRGHVLGNLLQSTLETGPKTNAFVGIKETSHNLYPNSLYSK